MTQKLESGYAFVAKGDLATIPNDDWETQVITPDGCEYECGRTRIDGTKCRVWWSPTLQANVAQTFREDTDDGTAFGKLSVGDTFDFVSPIRHLNSFSLRCTKTGPRSYTWHRDGRTLKSSVSSAKVLVYHVEHVQSA